MFKRLGMFDRSLGMFQPLGKFAAVFTPAELFASGEQGTWYDPSDFSSMYQDSAGTTPVTAVEQPVGKILDKSGNGNHATQSTTTSRPILRNLYNLLTYTEQFDNAAWTKSGATVSATTVNSPISTATADTLTATATTSFATYRLNKSTDAGNYTFSISIKKGISFSLLFDDATANGKGVIFDGSTGAYVNTVIIGTGWNIVSYNCVQHPSSSDWWFATVTFYRPTAGAGNYFSTSVALNSSKSTAYNGQTTIGDTLTVWGASLVPAQEATLPYQRVVTNTLGSGVYDSDVTKFPPYLYFDGVDDFLVTGNINFSATDKMSVFAGVRKLSDAALGVVTELSATIASNNGTFLLSAPNSAAANYNFSSKGTSQVDNAVTTYAAPTTNVVTGLAAISAPSNTIRVNGAATTVATSQGTGNYGSAYPLYIGRRGGTTSPFNGRIYSLITRGALTTTPQLEQTEQWVATKTGVTL